MGTLGATANWSVTYNNEFTPSYITLAASNGSYVDTLDAGDKTTGRTITFNTGLTGSGKLTKIGAGTLVLNGAAKVPVPAEGETAAVPGFTGTVELREGALTVKDSSVIGQGTLLINGGLTVAVTSADGYSLDAGSTLGTINLDGGTAHFGGCSDPERRLPELWSPEYGYRGINRQFSGGHRRYGSPDRPFLRHRQYGICPPARNGHDGYVHVHARRLRG